MKLSGKDWALVAIALLVVGACARLGAWQLDRLSQRRARNAHIAANLARPPLELGVSPIVADSVSHRRIRAAGVYDYAHERVRPARYYDDFPGVSILTPLRLADGSAVFVDRGWAPSVDALHVELRDYREPDTVEVTGLGVLLPRGLGDVDPTRLGDSLPYRILPFGVQQLASHAPTMLRRWPEPTISAGPHLFYAIQWFSFATIALVGTVVLLRTSRRSVKSFP
jgi:surfeit locus 1 family protein